MRWLQAAVLSVAIMGGTANAQDQPLEGWWGFDPDGCLDEDNQYRVAVGRFVLGEGGVKFSESAPFRL